ncbi:MAG: hypothetical protein NVSMB27_04280 [Ktedonobacteraceae bacterium]
MLVAYGPGNQPVVAEDTPPEELHHWSHEHALHCPNCRGIVHVRGGPDKRTQLHFAHQKGECAWSTESESIRHMSGKLLLAQWLRGQFPTALVTLEERLPEPNRIADVFVRHADGRCWAVEFQCAPLDIAEWRHRHTAYHNAGITDTWIIGANRREKQEAFLEAVLTTAQEILFLDPLLSPPRAWLRWPVPRREAQFWQDLGGRQETNITPGGWVGRAGYGITLTDELYAISLDSGARLVHPAKVARERRLHLLQAMRSVPLPDAAQVTAYFAHNVDEKALHLVLIPLVKAYLHDPELLQRYNYGRGHPGQPVSVADRERVLKAHSWLTGLERQGFSGESIARLIKDLPYVGAYAALATYAEMLLSLPHQA